MNETGIQQVSPNNTALSSENYQTFEMAKANDGILGGDDIAQIRSYAAYARAQAQAIHKTIAATSGIDDVAAIKAEATETAQTFAKVGIYADTRIGELLRELEQAKRGPKDNSDTQEKTKAEAIKESGISKSQAYDLQAMAANPEVVEAVIAKATEEGRVVSRKQVLDAINQKKQAERDRKRAEQERDAYMHDLEEAFNDVEAKDSELASLRKQLAEKPKPEVIEREVEVIREVAPGDYEEAKRRVNELEQRDRMRSEDNRILRKQLEETRKELGKAKDALGMDKTLQDVRSDVKYLIAATNSYIRQYGGLTWTVQQLELVDKPTRNELAKAATNLATFSSALVASLEQMQ